MHNLYRYWYGNFIHESTEQKLGWPGKDAEWHLLLNVLYSRYSSLGFTRGTSIFSLYLHFGDPPSQAFSTVPCHQSSQVSGQKTSVCSCTAEIHAYRHPSIQPKWATRCTAWSNTHRDNFSYLFAFSYLSGSTLSGNIKLQESISR